MIWAFDLDGTLCEAWYGKNNPGFYEDTKDQVTRSLIGDCYEYVKPLPYILPFLNSLSCYDKNPICAIISRVCNANELPQKIQFSGKNFISPNGELYFKPENIFGVVNDDEKLHIIEHLIDTNTNYNEPKQHVFYFDDNLSLLHAIYKNQSLKDKVSVFHSSSLAVRTPYDIISAYDHINE